jgi:hypothetical protein
VLINFEGFTLNKLPLLPTWHLFLSIDDLMSLVEDINYLFSWENPILTIFSMFLFVAGCLSFDSEYCLSLPLLFLLLWMLRFSFIRRDGARKTKFIRQEVEKLRKVIMFFTE